MLYLVFHFAGGAELGCTILSKRVEGWTRVCDNFVCRNVYQSTVINITCNGVGASFTKYSGRIESVILDSNISKLPSAAFMNLPPFSNLYLQNLGLTEIFPGAFNSQNNLTTIYLDGNNLRNISDGIFNSLMELRILNLSRNHINHITARAFVGTQLECLYLNNNNISDLSIALFNSLGVLKRLDLSSNNLSRINDLFKNLSVVDLNLSNNRLTTVDITSLLSLENIDLSNNKMECLIVDKRSHIQVLDISRNKISTLRDMLSVNLEILIAGDNSISDLENYTFENLFKLRELHLNNNNLSSILTSCFKDLRNLQYLNLSTNHLSNFIFGTFDSLSNLRTLDISNNKFRTLPYSLHSLYLLKNFYFQYNEISEINMAEFIREKPNLTHVQFNNNKWNCNKLMYIMNYFKQHAVSVIRGNCSEKSNVHGIECQENDNHLDKNLDMNNNISFHADIDTSKLGIFFNENFSNTVMYRFFNKEFRNSSFARYLESLNNTNNKNLTDQLNRNQESIDKLTDIIEKNQETSLTILRKLQDSLDSRITNQQAIEEIGVNFLDKLTERLSKNQETFLSHLHSNIMSNYKRRDGFQEEAFSAKYTSDNTCKKNNAVFVFILILLVVNIVVLTVIGYSSIFRKQKDNVIKKDVELSQLLSAST